MDPEAHEPARLDLSRYRTAQLGDRLAGVLSLPERLGQLVRTVALAVALTQASAIAVAWHHELPWWASALGVLYALVTGLLLGALTALLRLAWSEVGRVEGVLVELLQLCVQVLGDLDELGSGRTLPPSAGRLVDQAWTDVVAPLALAAAERQLGWLARPPSWLVRTLVGAAVRSLSDWLDRRVATGVQTVGAAGANAEDGPGSARRAIAAVAEALQAAHGHLGRFASGARRLLVPLIVGVGLAFLGAAAPVVVLAWVLR